MPVGVPREGHSWNHGDCVFCDAERTLLASNKIFERYAGKNDVVEVGGQRRMRASALYVADRT